ncbi:MAG TPA: helix-turn-helix domain-containing GNAT family N-acetyltransferase [Acidobacteriaceae bacterium]|jgi:DNA-binding MarR family transcriptional regulator/N-acetylglutamate synthase-like GNAT family acetyltransferase
MSVVDQVRQFNRFYTREIGLLAEHLPASDLSLAEARVLYELAQGSEPTAADIVRSLGMDKAHVSRIVARFRKRGLLRSRISPDHGKQKLLSLTAAGRKAFERLNLGTQKQIEALLAPVPEPNRQRLLEGMQAIQTVLDAGKPTADGVSLRPPAPGDLGWITHRQAVLYSSEYGWDWTYEGLVSQILGDFVAHYDAGREDAWVAEANGSIVGSVFLMKTGDPKLAKLRLLYVEPSARGLGVGTRLVRACIDRAKALGYERLTLWTNDVLISARRIYEAAGFRLMKQEKHRSFGHDLVAQTWELDLLREPQQNPSKARTS